MLSIIIPTKNEEKHLPMLLASLKTQTFQDFEVIVADAGSVDRTVEIAREWGAIVVPGGMPGPGRNRGAEAAKGEVLLFLDADVILTSSRFLEDSLKEFQERALDVACARVQPISEKQIDVAFHEIYNAFILAMEKVKPHAPGACIFVTAAAHREMNGFDEAVVYAEDCEYVQRAAERGRVFRVLRAHPVAISVRRFGKDGRLLSAFRYVYGEYHILMHGGIRDEQMIEYEMGGDLPSSKT